MWRTAFQSDGRVQRQKDWKLDARCPRAVVSRKASDEETWIIMLRYVRCIKRNCGGLSVRARASCTLYMLASCMLSVRMYTQLSM